MKCFSLGAAIAAAWLFLPAAAQAQQMPTIRIGHGAAAEEQLWLMKAMPSVAPHQGKTYKLDFLLFRGGDTRYKAIEAGEIDIATTTGHVQIFTASQGLEYKAFASVSRESAKGFATQYMVLDSSPIKTLQDLKGKIIGNNSARSSIELWARIGVAKGGLDPDRDVRWAIVPFPAQAEAVRSGKLDVGAFPQPFAATEMRRGGLRTLFTSKDANPYDEELMMLIVMDRFIKAHPSVVRDFLADFVAATKFYLANPEQAKRALIEAKMVNLPPEMFLAMKDYERAPDARIDIDSLRRMQEDMFKHGYTKKRVDIAQFIDLSYLPK